MQQTRIVIVVLLMLGVVSGEHRHLRSVLGAFFDTSVPPAEVVAPPVATCMGCKRNEEDDSSMMKETEHYSVTEQELTALRIEYIKQQILKKLRLKEKPMSVIAQLPEPVSEKQYLPIKRPLDMDDMFYRHYSDDFYGKTTQAIIFPYEDEAKCVRKIRYPSACIPFEMPTDIAASDVSSVELWFYKERDISDIHNQSLSTFIVSEVVHWDTGKSFQKSKPIAILERHLKESWITVDVTYVIKNWLMYQDSPTHAISVTCKTCGMNIYSSPISFRPSLKPFLVINTNVPRYAAVNLLGAPRRPKRHAECMPGGRECCRENLYVSFAEIGWNDWIIAPKGYNAYFCKGTCHTAAALTLNPSDYHAILRRVMYGSTRNQTQRLELTPCCAATNYRSLQLVYTDTNKTIHSKILPKMIVESCGCM